MKKTRQTCKYHRIIHPLFEEIPPSPGHPNSSLRFGVLGIFLGVQIPNLRFGGPGCLLFCVNGFRSPPMVKLPVTIDDVCFVPSSFFASMIPIFCFKKSKITKNIFYSNDRNLQNLSPSTVLLSRSPTVHTCALLANGAHDDRLSHNTRKKTHIKIIFKTI